MEKTSENIVEEGAIVKFLVLLLNYLQNYSPHTCTYGYRKKLIWFCNYRTPVSSHSISAKMHCHEIFYH